MPHLRLAPAALAALALAAPARLAAQDDKPEPVKLETIDGLKLSGNWYSGKGTRPPVAICLHAFSKDSAKGDWDGLARELQKLGYAVLTFDFRGHGLSKATAALFDDKQKFMGYHGGVNRYAVSNPRVFLKPDTLKSLDYAQFKPDYFPILLLDVDAARRFVDRRNETGQCNSGQILLIGDREGATLGQMWLVSENFRPGVYAKDPGLASPFAPRQKLPPPDAYKDYTGAFWLSAKPYTGKPLRILDWPKDVVDRLRDRIPMDFVVNAAVPAEEKLARQLLTDGLKVPLAPDAIAEKGTLKYITPVKDAGQGNSGIDLLTPAKSRAAVLDELGKFIKEIDIKKVNGREWAAREVDQSDRMIIPPAWERIGAKLPR